MLFIMAALSSVAHADDSFQPDGDDFSFAAGGGHVLSTYDDATGRTRLQEGFGAEAHALPVRPVSPRAGIDVGTDVRGRAVAVYGRCRPAPVCDLFAFSFAERRERRLGVSRRTCSEIGPRLDRGTLVFYRSLRRSPKRALRCTPGLFEKRRGLRLRRVAREAPQSYDYADGMLAFQRSVIPPEGGGFSIDEIRLLRIGGGPSRLIARAPGFTNRGDATHEDTSFSETKLSGGFVHWIRAAEDFSSGERVTTADVLRTAVNGGGPFTSLDRAGRLFVGNRSEGGDTLFEIAVDGDLLLYELPNGIGRVGPGPPLFQ